MKWTLTLCCLLGVTHVYGGQGFYFPDEVGAKAQSNSDAWSDGHGNSHASAGSNAVSGDHGGGGGGGRYPGFYKPSSESIGLNAPDYDGDYPGHGYNPIYERPQPPPYNPRPYPGHGVGQSQANANAQSTSQGHGGNSISNALANSQSLGPNGGASAASAAAAAGTTFVNGVPVASASAAAAAAVASPHGAGASSASSSATAGGGGRGGHQYLGPPHHPGSYDGPHYGQYQQQPWLYRSGGGSADEAVDDGKDGLVVEAAPLGRSSDVVSDPDAIVFREE